MTPARASIVLITVIPIVFACGTGATTPTAPNGSDASATHAVAPDAALDEAGTARDGAITDVVETDALADNSLCPKASTYYDCAAFCASNHPAGSAPYRDALTSCDVSTPYAPRLAAGRSVRRLRPPRWRRARHAWAPRSPPAARASIRCSRHWSMVVLATRTVTSSSGA